MRNDIIYQLLGCSLLEIDRSYWAVKLANDEWICEARIHTDPYSGIMRNFEWYEDLVQNNDVAHIKELWLLCPSNKLSPLGNTAMLPILEPNSAFNFKRVHTNSNFVDSWKVPEAHIIGRVNNKTTGDCVCFIWDDHYQVLTEPFYSNVHNFHSWRNGIPHLGKLAIEKMGVKL